MTFIPLFGPITKLSLRFVTFRVSRFPVSHLTHETVKLGLQNTLNMSKTTRVYFGVLQLTNEQKEKFKKQWYQTMEMNIPMFTYFDIYAANNQIYYPFAEINMF